MKNSKLTKQIFLNFLRKEGVIIQYIVNYYTGENIINRKYKNLSHFLNTCNPENYITEPFMWTRYGEFELWNSTSKRWSNTIIQNYEKIYYKQKRRSS